MTGSERGLLPGQCERLFREGTSKAQSHCQLRERYVSLRDESVLAAIVPQHGPMVLSFCRRFLRDPHDVEDAFQATFLVLVRKGPSLRQRELLASWLYGVAYRVAVRARSIAIRRKAR